MTSVLGDGGQTSAVALPQARLSPSAPTEVEAARIAGIAGVLRGGGLPMQSHSGAEVGWGGVGREGALPPLLWQGDSPEVPEIMRGTGKVRNRMMAKAEAQRVLDVCFIPCFPCHPCSFVFPRSFCPCLRALMCTNVEPIRIAFGIAFRETMSVDACFIKKIEIPIYPKNPLLQNTHFEAV